MNQDRTNQLIATLTLAAMAIILVGGTVAGWLLGRDPPGWLIGFDGVIITAAFGSGAFFVQARTAAPTAVLAQQIQEDHHELAMGVTSMMMPTMSSGTTSDPERLASNDGPPPG